MLPSQKQLLDSQHSWAWTINRELFVSKNLKCSVENISVCHVVEKLAENGKRVCPCIHGQC